MNSIGKEMAEALLESESDESTASLSDSSIGRDAFEEAPAIMAIPTSSLSAKLSKPRRDIDPNGTANHHPSVSSPMLRHLSSVSKLSYDQRLMAYRYVALDCEMVGVGPGGTRSVLARVSIVDYFGTLLFDSFVRVEERVTDFRSHVTGISAKDLSSCGAMSFGQCRQKVIKFLRNKILVGHGLENDLAVLGITHPWYNIRDTSTYPPYQKMDRFGRLWPNRLRALARIHLGINIQDERCPHCPIEDACAAMALYRNFQLDWDYVVDYRRRDILFRERRNYRSRG